MVPSVVAGGVAVTFAYVAVVVLFAFAAFVICAYVGEGESCVYTIYLLVIASSDQLLLKFQTFLLFSKQATLE